MRIRDFQKRRRSVFGICARCTTYISGRSWRNPRALFLHLPTLLSLIYNIITATILLLLLLLVCAHLLYNNDNNAKKETFLPMTMITTPTVYTVISLDAQSNQNTTRYQVCVRANPSKPRCHQCTKTLLCTSGAIFRSIKTSRATSLGGQLQHHYAADKSIPMAYYIHVCFIQFFPMFEICLECTCWVDHGRTYSPFNI